jgi:hypothetical protein
MAASADSNLTTSYLQWIAAAGIARSNQSGDWMPATTLTPEFANDSFPDASDVKLWHIARRKIESDPSWLTLLANKGFTGGVHYWEVRVVRPCNFMIGVVSPSDNSIITEENLASHLGAAGNPLLGTSCTAFSSFHSQSGRSVRDIVDMGFDTEFLALRDRFLSTTGLGMAYFNTIRYDRDRVYTLTECWDKFGWVQRHLAGEYDFACLAKWYKSRNISTTYPYSLFDWAGCRVGFLMDLHCGQLHLLLYRAGNSSTSVEGADKKVLFGTLLQGRRYFPATSMQGCDGALELRTGARLPGDCPELVEQLQETAALVQEYRTTMAGLDIQIQQQQKELDALRAQL